MKLKLTFITLLLNYTYLLAQTTSTFENLSLSSNSFEDGANLSGSFSSGNALFPNVYNTTFSYWESGWAFSNKIDSTTGPSNFNNLFDTKAGMAFSGNNFIVGTQDAVIKLTGNAIGKVVTGFYITNTTYNFNSMKNGDMFAKKFGGISGNDPDYFKLTIKKFLNGQLANDSVEYYLADFRFANNSQDYIVKSWDYVNLTSLGNVDSLLFTLSSSDVGQFGINTPLYYNIDNFITSDMLSISENKNLENEITVYPNPCKNFVTISSKEEIEKIEVKDISGKVLAIKNSSNSIDISGFTNGQYIALIYTKHGITTKKISKI